MAEENIPAPTRSDDQLVPVKARLPYVKSNLLLDLQKLQKNPIFYIYVDILQNTNFLRTFTTSANVPSIYIQQLWNTLTQDAKTRVYNFQLDEQWFNLDADLLRKALEITPVDSTHPFQSPPAGDIIMDFVNELGYPKEIHFVSKMHVNNLYQPWRAILSRINQTTVERVYTRDPNFLFSSSQSEYYYQEVNASRHSLLQTIQKSEYYQQYLEMVARKPQAKEVGKKQTTPKADKPGKISIQLVDEEEQTQPEPKPEPAPEPQGEEVDYDLQRDLHKPKKRSTTDQYIFQRRTPATEEASNRPSAQHEDDTYANVVRDTPSPADAETGVDTEKTNSENPTKILDVGEERGEDISNIVALEERIVELEEGQVGSDPGKTPESRPPPEQELMEEDQVGSDPGQSHVALARPNPEPMNEDFIAIVYP
ncbi:hypothetical protein Tco_0495918 [Tanacetum coccineum]